MSKIRPYNYKQDKAAIKMLLLETVKPKTNDVESFVIHGIGLNSVLIGIYSYTFEELLDKFTLSDGSPCGIEEDEK